MKQKIQELQSANTFRPGNLETTISNGAAGEQKQVSATTVCASCQVDEWTISIFRGGENPPNRRKNLSRKGKNSARSPIIETAISAAVNGNGRHNRQPSLETTAIK